MAPKASYEELQQRVAALEAENAELKAEHEKAARLHFLGNANSIILRMDAGGRVTFVNEFAQRFFGYSEAEILGRSVVGTIVPAIESTGRDLDSMIKALGEAPNRFTSNQNENMCKDGSRVWIAWTNKALYDDQGGIAEILCIGNDVTELKRAERQLNFQSLLLNQIQDCITATDLEGNITYVNEAEVINYAADGRELVLDCRTRLVKDEYGQPVSIVGISTDITDRKQAEAALRQSEKRFRSLFDQAPIGIMLSDAAHNVLDANPRALALLGYHAKDEITRLNANDLLHPENVQQLPPDTLVQRLWAGEIIDTERRYCKKDGSYIDVWVSMRTFASSDEQVSHLVLFQDITDWKRAREETALLQEQFQQAQKMESIGRLAGGVAHDLNNLLSPILGYGELLLEDAAANNPIREPIEEILNAGKRAQALVRQLLAFSRKQSLQFQDVNMNSLLENFQKLLRRTLREDIELQMKLAPSVPEIKGDLGQLEQVVMNLAVNSQDAMPRGGRLIIETALAELDEDSAMSRFSTCPAIPMMSSPTTA